MWKKCCGSKGGLKNTALDFHKFWSHAPKKKRLYTKSVSYYRSYRFFFSTDFNVHVIPLKPHTILLVYLPLSSHPTSSIRSVQALRQITGMMRMNWAMMGGSNRLVFVLSLSVFARKTCSTWTWNQAQEVGREWNLPFEIMLTKSSYLVSPLALHPESSVHIPIEATRHFKGLDVLGRAHATGTLSDDSCQTHFLLHIYLFIKKKKWTVKVWFTLLTTIPMTSEMSTVLVLLPQSRGSCHGWLTSKRWQCLGCWDEPARGPNAEDPEYQSA